ncbi:hypothetical protein K432DRAFT_378010 [Lepidopterella palustris CBS 459.81]|uniref:Opioid growth factor receptor (OGFr) conserved domain-containing protein n=1 Tax=Lepidopterella palustris CBS 459.81 TaxID=1314670 RepID=A0A8E2JJT1_9PEZI|nr:hypothetical protein K432DRAFT_378010 [Lepidopterella palustris CBS 459.81]
MDADKVRNARNNFFHIIKRQRTSKTNTVPSTPYSVMPSSNAPTSLDFHGELGEDSCEAPDGLSPPPKISRIPLIIRFFDPAVSAPDARGRTLDEILEWPDEYLEQCHNYIQMLFPLPEGSPFNMTAPVIDPTVFYAFRSREDLRANLKRAFERMLKFYGFEIKEGIEAKEQVEANGQAEAKDEVDAKDQDAVGVERKVEVRNETDAEANGEPKEEIKDTKNDVGEEVKEVSKKEAEEEAKVQIKGKALYEVEVKAKEETMGEIKDEIKKGVGGEAESQVQEQAAEQPDEKEEEKEVQEGLTNRTEENEPQEGLRIAKAPHYRQAFRNWVHRFDHNHLRLTRILRSLRVLGLQEECEALFDALVDVYETYGRISERSVMYWKRAVTRPLWIAPDDDKVFWLKRVVEEIEAEAARAGEAQERDQTVVPATTAGSEVCKQAEALGRKQPLGEGGSHDNVKEVEEAGKGIERVNEGHDEDVD